MWTRADLDCEGCTRCTVCGWQTCTEQTGHECPDCLAVLCPECVDEHQRAAS